MVSFLPIITTASSIVMIIAAVFVYLASRKTGALIIVLGFLIGVGLSIVNQIFVMLRGPSIDGFLILGYQTYMTILTIGSVVTAVGFVVFAIQLKGDDRAT